MTPKITVFGEILWDVLPTSKLAGGAPMNVAAHLHHQGVDTDFISRVGNDDLGKELLVYLKNRGLELDLVQTGETHLTGVAKANISDSNEVTYKILHPVAWDYIQFDNKALKSIKESDLFVYGSLACRDETTYTTLLKYLPEAKIPVFDINLRPPHYTSERVLELMKYAKIVKMNEHEIKEVCDWLSVDMNMSAAMAFLKKSYDLQTVIVTCGPDGAIVLSEENRYFSHPGFKVDVADTIGSGDSFLATYLNQTLNGTSIDKALEYACAVGAFVASQEGAIPTYSPNDITALISQQYSSSRIA